MNNVLDSVHVLWQEAMKHIPPTNGCFYTKEEFKKHEGKISILSGHVHKIEKNLNL